VDKSRKNYATDWENLQRPGFSPDFQEQRFERIDLAFERDDWIPSEGAKALMRNNMPLLGYIAGKDGDFTEKGHNFFPGEIFGGDDPFVKQLIIVNNSRKTVECKYQYHLKAVGAGCGSGGRVTLETGTIKQIPMYFPEYLSEPFDIVAKFEFDTGEVQEDTFTIHIMPPLESLPSLSVALFDPHGETAKMLDELGVKYHRIGDNHGVHGECTEGTEDCTPESPCPPCNLRALRGKNILIIGNNALSLTDDGIDLSQVPEGQRVIVFEQSAEVLEKRLGFRTAEYGLRNVFKRVPDHPVLKNIEQENLRDWRGAATLLSVPMEYQTNDNVFNGVPTAEWCGITMPRVWRSSNRGSVASVLIEKPTCGDFLPILDGGFSLQYSPLLEYRHGKGMILFCQMDVTGRDLAGTPVNDPAALHLVNNILRYVDEWEAEERWKTRFIGMENEKKYLDKIGVNFKFDDGTSIRERTVVVFGPRGLNGGTDFTENIRLVAVGLRNQHELSTTFLPLPGINSVTVKDGEHISTYFEPFGMSSPLRGISPADLHNRDPRVFPLITNENIAVGNGILGVTDEGRTVIVGMAPWQFASDEQSFKRTFRRSAFVLSRILGNMNVDLRTPLVERFNGPVGANEKRWLDGLYLDEPEEWDYPYRFFRW